MPTSADPSAVSTAAARLSALRRDDQRAAALRGVRPTELLDVLAAELERLGADELLALVRVEQDRRAEIRTENERIVAEAVALRVRRDKVIATFERGMTIDLRGREYRLMEARRTTNGIDGWSISSVRWGTWFFDNDELADAMLAKAVAS